MGVELPTRGCNGGSSTKDVRKLVFVIGTLPERQEMLPRRTKEFVIVPTSFQLAGMAKSRWPGFYQITTNEEMIDDVRHVSTTMYLPPLSGDAGDGEVISLNPGELQHVLKVAVLNDGA